MTVERTPVLSQEELDTWQKPDRNALTEARQPRYDNAQAGMTAVFKGEMSIRAAAKSHGLCRTRLGEMVRRAPQMAPDGVPWGFRVCVPWGAYHRSDNDVDTEQAMPIRAQPHAMENLLKAQPTIAEWVHAYSTPLPPGRPPANFDRLHEKILIELRKKDLHDFYPLNRPDKGREALLRYLRSRRIKTSPAPDMEKQVDGAPSRIAELFRGEDWDRVELDGHRIDTDAPMQIEGANGEVVTRKLSVLWLLVAIECKSRAVISWMLSPGRNYSGRDVIEVLSRSMRPWAHRALTIPGVAYASDAGMPSSLSAPSGFRRALMVAVDNHKGHHDRHVKATFCHNYDGILMYGRPHQPRERPFVEQFNSRIERGALRLAPGGYEPATKLGGKKRRTSKHKGHHHPMRLHLADELMDVIIANYNATAHPAHGHLSPLQYLDSPYSHQCWCYEPSDGETSAEDMDTITVPLIVHGNRDTGVLPHVNYAYVRYRCPELDDNWELIGKTVLGRVNRNDLRSFALYLTATKPIGVVRAAAPWNYTRHDEKTRKLICGWAKPRGGLKLKGVECAVQAYVEHLSKLASESQQAVDELGRVKLQHPSLKQNATHNPLLNPPVRPPKRGWISLDDVRHS